jgi:deazaflavin-dependent oxidoreductase (nitroreductase family)
MLGYLEDAPGAWLVVASLAGAKRNPGWLHNLSKEPRAEIELGEGHRVGVRAEALQGDALDAAWKRFETDAPEYVAYLSKTDRVLPIIRLASVAAEAPVGAEAPVATQA